MGPLVSVLIPTFNRPDLLPKAINSALLQSYNNIEVIVSDNSSTTETEEVVSRIVDPRLSYSRSKDIGLVPNWRKLLNRAKGEYCLIISDDDFFINPFYIESAVAIAQRYAVKLVIPDCVLAKPNKKSIGSSGYSGLIDGKLFVERFWKSFYVPSSVNLFDRSAALDYDAFLSNETLYPDIELWLKFMSFGNVYCYDVPSVYYLFHENNLVMNMSTSALLGNSKFIRRSVSSFASEELICELVCRYVLFVDGLYRLVDYAFIKSVFRESGVRANPAALLLKCRCVRAKVYLKDAVKGIIKWNRAR
jgi:glycosyltransferase involved in cell wall biosynthesis